MTDKNHIEIEVGDRIAYTRSQCETITIGTVIETGENYLTVLGDGNSKLGRLTKPCGSDESDMIIEGSCVACHVNNKPKHKEKVNGDTQPE